jgi:hypothetical protein
LATTKRTRDTTERLIAVCTKGRLVEALDAIAIGRISHPDWTPVIEQHDGAIRLVATNLSDYATYTLAEQVAHDFQPTPFVPTHLRRLLRGVKNDDFVKLWSIGEGTAQLRLDAPSWSATMPYRSTMTYRVPSLTGTLDVPTTVFDAMRKVAPAASRDALRPALTKVWTHDGATIATDSYLLLGVEHGWKPPRAAKLDVLGISAAVARHAPSSEHATEPVFFSDRHFGWGNGNGGHTFAEQAPDSGTPVRHWRTLGPARPAGSIVFDRQQMLDALALFIEVPREQHVVVLTVEGKRLLLQSRIFENVPVPKIDAEIPVDIVARPPTTMAFSAAFLRSLITAFTSRDVVLRLEDALKPAEIEQDGMKGLLMPVRVS